MQRLYRKRIVLGVGGGIAAYKSAELVRRLLDQGAEVRVVMTRGGSYQSHPMCCANASPPQAASSTLKWAGPCLPITQL